MDITILTTLVALILAVSLASERLVEIVRGIFPGALAQPADRTEEGKPKEARRRAKINALGVGAGIVTAFLASPAILELFPDFPDGFWPKALLLVGVGLLASGGSGIWNSILEYLNVVKKIKADST